MPVQIGATPDSGFDDPIGMLTDCHRRIENFLRVLELVCHRATGRALTEEESSAVQASLDYFRRGGRRHTADEEESLFPRLRAQLSAENFKELDGLEHEHEFADARHAEVDDLYTRWISVGTLSEAESRRLAAAVDELVRMYTGHIRIEEEIVFPRAAKVLDAPTVKEIGNEFRLRRA
ncbi:MAG TPA: hemerythrin domain-containing protein [Terracidiphilus sp.]|nr:hemerythrin domain-containing protein [Terracidiphilus sp.]